MSNQAERAAALFRGGYNCAQAVFTAYCEEMGIDEAQALRLTSSFGGGMGRLREVCGAVSGMFLVAGSRYGYADADDTEGKTRHYQLIQSLASEFRSKYGSIICRDLLLPEDASSNPVPSERTAEYYKRRPCEEYVRFAAQLLDRLDEEGL